MFAYKKCNKCIKVAEKCSTLAKQSGKSHISNLQRADRYEIIGLRKISHFIKQLCRNVCVKKRYKCIEVAEKCSILAENRIFRSTASFQNFKPRPNFVSQPAIRSGSARCRHPDFSQVMYSRVPFTDFSIC